MDISKMTRDEKSLLLYLESRAVDYRGIVDIERMNDTDVSIAKRWGADGFITYASENVGVRGHNQKATLSDDAWSIAHALRKERGTK